MFKFFALCFLAIFALAAAKPQLIAPLAYSASLVGSPYAASYASPYAAAYASPYYASYASPYAAGYSAYPYNAAYVLRK